MGDSPTTTADSLMCDHCGGDAVTSSDGRFCESQETGACADCGYPGRVVIDDEDGAFWSIADLDGGVCNDFACSECAELREERTDSATKVGGGT